MTQAEQAKLIVDPEDLIKKCMQIITETPKGRTPQIVSPVEHPRDTKKNKVRFSPIDRTSPVGVVLKHPDALAEMVMPKQYAYARFNCYEMVRWLGVQLGPMHNPKPAEPEAPKEEPEVDTSGLYHGLKGEGWSEPPM